ncbi:hypothetical protein [Terracidiphilus sp.]|uniref:hypothetical protein n=1 Tax=Terracidiphilus sp. TaxID=1964191 RepID=UPI003C1D4837
MSTTMLQASGTSNSRSTADMASAYVPIESWVYPALDRLAAEGYVPGAIFSLYTWMRIACARMVAANLQVRPEWQPGVENQAEWWRFPLLSPTPQRNDALTIQISYSAIARRKP